MDLGASAFLDPGEDYAELSGRQRRTRGPGVEGAAQSNGTREVAKGAFGDMEGRGPVLARRAVPVAPGETPEQLEARVTALEPGFFVDALQNSATGKTVLP